MSKLLRYGPKEEKKEKKEKHLLVTNKELRHSNTIGPSGNFLSGFEALVQFLDPFPNVFDA